MKVLITGGAGFIGSNIAEALINMDMIVVVLDNFSLGGMENLRQIKDKIKIIKGDIRSERTVMSAAKNVDFILHQAAASSSPMFRSNLKSSIKTNVDGFINVLDAAKENNIKRVVYASTSSLYGNVKSRLKEENKLFPPNFYATTKVFD